MKTSKPQVKQYEARPATGVSRSERRERERQLAKKGRREGRR